MAVQISESVGDVLFSLLSSVREESAGYVVDEALIKAFGSHVRQLCDAGLFPTRFETPLVAQLELTSRCNLSCIQCYNDSKSSASATELTIEEWKDVATQFSDMKIFQCIISGGEPLLLGDGLWEIMDCFHSSGIAFIFITNGYLVDEHVLSKLKRYRYYWFQVSIDGATAEIHDKIRGKSGSWKRATKAVFDASCNGLPVEVAHVLLKQNIDSVGEMIDLAYSLGASRMVLGRHLASGRGAANDESIRPSDESLRQAEEVIARKHLEYRNRMEVKRALNAPNSLRLNLAAPNFGLIIRPNGDVKIDCVLPFTLGNVRQSTIKDLWETVGCNIWQNSRVRSFVESVTDDDSLLTVSPRPYVDADELLQC